MVLYMAELFCQYIPDALVMDSTVTLNGSYVIFVMFVPPTQSLDKSLVWSAVMRVIPVIAKFGGFIF